MDNTINKLSNDCTSLLGKNFGITKPIIEITTLKEFINSNEENYFLIKTGLEDSYDGYIPSIIQLRDAIKISCVLLGFEEKDIKERIHKEHLDTDCTDAITEFSRQFSGIIDSVFRNKLPKPVHAKLSLCTAFHKDNAKEILHDIFSDEFISLSSLLLIQGFDTGKFNMFFPIESVEEFFGETVHAKSANILVTDDSSTDIRVIKRYLSNTPFRVITAHNANETFAVLQREKIQLILLDCILPEQSGIEICRNIKKTPYTKGIPLIMMSGKPTHETVIESLKAGARDFLVKPFNKERLLQKIDKYKPKKKLAALF
ncbi:MAG: response regulator [Candidatus Brocadiaceae baterium WH-1]|nr:MAG: response regulator [Candidatus Jettenia sp. AMX2]